MMPRPFTTNPAATSRHRPVLRGLLCLLGLAALAPTAWAGKTLEGIRQHGQLTCGVAPALAGFSAADSQGRWQGLDVDICRALAAAVIGSGDKVKWVPLASQQRFAALQSGEVDILSRNTTWTLTRDAGQGFHFTAITYYDGQGFLVPRKFQVTSARQLQNTEVCVQAGTTTEKNLTDFARANNLKIKPIVFDSYEASLKAFFSGRCQAYTTDTSSLASIRAKEAPKPEDYLILPEQISKEPLAPLIRRGDDEWFAVVKWVIYALQEAEELGITQANAASRRNDADPAVRRLLGSGDDLGKSLGLDKDWAYRAITAVGNYGEIFDRNLGALSPLKLPRGANALWTQGGRIYPLPLR